MNFQMTKPKATSKKTESKTLLKPKSRKFCTYSNASLQAALQAIRETGISVREASRRYGIPRATVHDKLTGKSPAEKKKTGPPPLLTVIGEKKIADWVINSAKRGFPISKTDLMEAVAKIATDTVRLNSFPNGKPGVRWYKGFLKRHPEISQREAEGINRARASVTEESIRSWFTTLQKYLEDNGFQDILEDSSRIFNGDESGFSLCPKTGKVLGPKGWKNLYVIKSGKEKENTTVLITFNASGAVCPPLVIFPYVRPPKSLVQNVPRNWVIGKSDSGWMTGEVFFEYISNDFNSWLTTNQINRPVLLLIDGHKSHMTLPLSQFCDENKIILYALPPNTTHILQPADVSVFKPMKQEWKNTVKNWQKRPENSNQIITKINFCQVFEETLQNTQMQSHIVKGFRKCGLYPFNPDNVDYTKCVKKILEKECQQTVSAGVSEKTLTVNDFEAARRVIESISNDLIKYGVNVDVVITEIKFQKSLLEKDSNTIIQPSTAPTTSADQAVNIAVGSIVPMDHVTLLPVDIMEFEEGGLLNFENNSWISNENSESELFTEQGNLRKENDIDIENEKVTVLNKKRKIASEKQDYIRSIEADDFCENEIVTFSENEKENRNESENSGEIEIFYNEKEKSDENDAGDAKENEGQTTTEIDRYKENEEGNKENDNGHKKVNQQESTKESWTGTGEKRYTKNKEEILGLVKQTDMNKAVILHGKLHDITNLDSRDENAQNKETNKDLMGKTKEVTESNDKDEALTPDPFQKHLTFPEVSLKKKEGSCVKEKLPNAISSAAWRAYYSRKDDEKKEKLEKANLRRKIREAKKGQNQTKPYTKSKKKVETSMNDKTKVQSSTSKDKVLCTLCEEELISDVEDDGNKNIGCDECPRWYHLKCTDMSDLSYNDAAQKDYICDMCR
ncbi:uncharacterized protein [Diabrotica undecimpunctata]|uniref:uncharacterized protein isoform X1 n=2 Tax=Diabrotica undecimpunctata TaxID=50387 RepID=UPI003B6395E7